MPLDANTPDQDEYFALRDKLKALWEVPVPDMQAIEAVMQRLDDCHARLKATHKREDDTQRY